MSDKIFRRIEAFANVAIIVVAVLLGVTLTRNFILTDSAPPARAADVKLGAKLALPGVDWAESERHLVLVLQRGCHFCTESAHFYRRLVGGAAGRSDLRLIAALPQGVGESRQYLQEIGVVIDEVRQAAPSSLGARGTPTLLLVDASGAVTDAWVGKLSPAGEEAVLRRLGLE